MRKIVVKVLQDNSEGAKHQASDTTEQALRIMLEAIAKHLKDVSVLRRLLFAVATIPSELPNFWDVAVEFATSGQLKCANLDAKTAQVLMENVETFDKAAFSKDEDLMHELVSWVPRASTKPLGITLISPKRNCSLCSSSLSLRKDRYSSVTIYHSTMGPTPGSHFHKICSGKKCSLIQYYGYYSCAHGDSKSKVIFDSDWASHEYFVSSSLTAFSMLFIRQVDSQVLIGQLSYLQVAELFNHVHSSYSYDCGNQ